jgi:FkbM family methyltransferase
LSAEESYLASLDFNGRIVYDVGAFIGLRTLFFAQRAKQVISYEPNPFNRERLLRNLAANSSIANVTVRPFGVGQKPGSFTVLWDRARPGECVAEHSPVGDTLVARGIHVDRETVPVVTLDEETQQLPKPDFIKVDVEGLELDVLRGADQVIHELRPELFIELHGSTLENKIENATTVLDFLFERGYTIYDVEERFFVEPGRQQRAPSHIHCLPAK